VGTVDGVVTNDSLEPRPGVLAVLVPDRGQPERYRTTMTNARGRFSFQDVPAGDYRIFAWESIEPNAWLDPDVIRAVESNGERVHVDESAEINASVRIIPAQ
jgi:hypothetical protein